MAIALGVVKDMSKPNATDRNPDFLLREKSGKYEKLYAK
jgi:hypothetical protein